MNIDNVVLVRAMTHLPLNGELIPSCEGKRLVPDKKSDFFYFMYKYVENYLEQKLGRTLNPYNNSDEQLIENTMLNYVVLTGDYYTTTLSFSLNGLVPDDMHNNFSSMKLAVIEPLKNQTEADFVTIETIDTTVKGRMKTSKEAILVVENEFFKNLSSKDQENLSQNFKISFFDGLLADAVSETLIANGYPSLPLIQNREMKNINECLEKKSMLEFEDKFSIMVGASRARLQELTFMYSVGSGVNEIAHNKIKEEHTNTLVVEEYYKNQLYEFLLNKAETFGIEVSDSERHYLFTDFQDGIDAMKRITTSLIEAYGGFENFQSFIDEYNQFLQDNYLTNQQIVLFSNNKRKN